MHDLSGGGDEVARISKLTNPLVPIFAMSGYEDRYNRMHFDDYFKKPFDAYLLVEQIKLKLGL